MVSGYHPQNADQTATSDYIELTKARLTPKNPNANYVVTGDFNRLPLGDICDQCGQRDIVNFHTREETQLELVLTDVPEYDPAVKLSPIGQNDHCCILVKGKECHRSNYTKIKRRLITAERKNALLADWSSTKWD